MVKVVPMAHSHSHKSTSTTKFGDDRGNAHHPPTLLVSTLHRRSRRGIACECLYCSLQSKSLLCGLCPFQECQSITCRTDSADESTECTELLQEMGGRKNHVTITSRQNSSWFRLNLEPSDPPLASPFPVAPCFPGSHSIRRTRVESMPWVSDHPSIG